MSYYITPNITSTNITVAASSSVTAASSGYITLNGSNGINGADIKPNSLSVHGNADFNADVEIAGHLKINGVNIVDTLARIETRLNILQINTDLESEWDELRELGDRYRAMERDMLEKLELIKLLKTKY
jgi:hypothetical protein